MMSCGTLGIRSIERGYEDVSMATRLSHPQEIRTVILEDVRNAAPLLTTWPMLKMQRQAEQVGLWQRIWQRIKEGVLRLQKGAT